MTTRAAVLVMAKAPRPGTVKTRLSPLLGPAGCAQLAACLIRHAADLAHRAAPGATYLAVDPPEAAGELVPLVPAGAHVLPQRGEHLGKRMMTASADVLAQHPGPLIVIGTDAPTLSLDFVERAVAELADHDMVFGPAADGGYYLIGLCRLLPEVFKLAPGAWGGPDVLGLSLDAARSRGVSAALLPVLRDLDTPDDARTLLADPGLPADIAALLRSGGSVTSPRPGTEPSVSIVVPTLNEVAVVEGCLGRLRRDFPGCELVVADGGSTDGTQQLAGAQATVVESPSGRARQMNNGAYHTTGELLWFIHADTVVEPNALDEVRRAMADPSVVGGGLSLRFDRRNPALDYLSWSSNLRARHLHWVFGDQALFMRRDVFDELDGFPDLPLMEDLEMSRRLHRRGRLVVLSATSTASARRFEHGPWRMIAFMQYLKILYFAGVDPQVIRDRYAAGPSLRRPKPTSEVGLDRGNRADRAHQAPFGRTRP